MFFRWRPQVAGLPELVVGGVLRHLGPEGDILLEVLLVDVGERAQAEEEAVAVLLRERVGRRPGGRRHGGHRAADGRSAEKKRNMCGR